MVYEPQFTAVAITPNPVNINSAFTIAVSVVDAAIVMYKVSKIAGAAISGGTTNLTTHNEEVS